MVTFRNGIAAQAVIFDFDGVIVDTEPLHYRSFQKILEPLGLGFSWEEYCTTYMGFDDRDAFIEAFSKGGIQLVRDELQCSIDKKADIFQEIISEGVTPYPGVIEMVRQLHIMNVPIAICSGALRSDIIPILTQLGIQNCFDTIVTAEDVAKSKPDPASYRLAFQRLCEQRGLKIENSSFCVAIEDTPAGIESAKGAELKVIAVTNSYASNYLTAADCIVESMASLLPITA